jgi:uncharacterized protein (DUF2267 family)
VSFDELIRSVDERAAIGDLDEAETTALVVVQALCNRLTGDEAHDLLAQLPSRLKTAVIVSPAAQPLGADEFVQRVAEELEVEPDEARTRIRAVFATLREAVTRGEFQDVLEQLDPEYADLLA